MKKWLTVVVAIATSLPLLAQGQIKPQASSTSLMNGEQATAAPDSVASATSLVLLKDTPVHLMVLNEVSTKEHIAGHRFKLRVDKPVMLQGTVVIPVGTNAWGELLNAETSGNLGRAGRLSARLTHIELKGQSIAIVGETSAKGRTATAETVVGVLSLGIFGLFAKGNNAKIKAGERITAFVASDTPIATSRQ